MTRPKKAAKKTTPWRATSYVRDYRGVLITITECPFGGWDWSSVCGSMCQNVTLYAAQRAAMAAVRGAKG